MALRSGQPAVVQPPMNVPSIPLATVGRVEPLLCPIEEHDEYYMPACYEVDANKPTKRSGHRMVYWKGKLIVSGGYCSERIDSGRTMRDLVFCTVWEFNLHRRQWVLRQHVFDDKTYPSVPSDCLISHSCDVVGDHLLIFGGTGFPFGQHVADDTWLVSLVNYEWTLLETVGDAPSARYGHATCLSDDRQCLYLFGGTNGQEFFNDLFRFEIGQKRWKCLCPVSEASVTLGLPEPRYRSTMICFNQRLYVFGGGNETSKLSIAQPVMFDLQSHTWSTLDTGISDATYAARDCHSSVLDNRTESVYLIGGRGGDNSAFDTILQFSLRSHSWRVMPVSLPSVLYFHESVLSPDGELLIFGGVTNPNHRERSNCLLSVWLRPAPLRTQAWSTLLTYLRAIGFDLFTAAHRTALRRLGVPNAFLDETFDLSLHAGRVLLDQSLQPTEPGQFGWLSVASATRAVSMFRLGCSSH